MKTKGSRLRSERLEEICGPSLLAFDYGLRRIGVATGQTVSSTASPLASIAAKNGLPDWRALDRTIDTWRPDRLIVGLPLNMDGTESKMCKRARRFGTLLERRYSIRVEFADERLTTREAKQLGSDADNHAIAACLIAETWLGSQCAGRRLDSYYRSS